MTQRDAGIVRIAVVTQGYQTAGGIQTAARWLVNKLRATGYEVTVFDLASSRVDRYSRRLACPRTWRRASLVTIDGCEAYVNHVGANGVEIELFRYLPRRDLTSELHRAHLIQIVAGGPALALSASRAQRPIVLQVASAVAWERSSRALSTSPLNIWRRAMSTATSRMERLALKRMSMILVLNRRMQEFVQSATRVPVRFAPPGIDTGRFSPNPGGWNSNGYMLSVCRLNDDRKGLDRLIRAYGLATRMRPSLPNLVLAGRGPFPVHLYNLLIELRLEDRVTIRSDVPFSDLPVLYREASVYLQASHEEGLGISVLEAMASGLPVVTTETAGTLETVAAGQTGWLIAQGVDVERDVAQRTLSIWEGYGDAMSRNARSRAVSMFSEGVAFSRILEVYSALLPSPPVGAP